MTRPSTDYLNARRDAKPANGGTNYRARENGAYEAGIKERDKAMPAFDWRAHLKTHPAAECFPLMREIDVKGFEALVADIKAHGLREHIYLWSDGSLLDGRNRLDALAELGALRVAEDGGLGFAEVGSVLWPRWWPMTPPLVVDDGDPYALVASWNAHRRHLTPAAKRAGIDALLKARPDLSDRQIAEQAGSTHPTVAERRKKGEAEGDVEKLSTRTDTTGRKQPAKKKKTEPKPKTPPTPVDPVRHGPGDFGWSAPAEPKTPESAPVPVTPVKLSPKLRKATQQLAADIAVSGDDAQAILVEGIERIESQITSLIAALQRRAAPPSMMAELADALSLITRKAVNALTEKAV